MSENVILTRKFSMTFTVGSNRTLAQKSIFALCSHSVLIILLLIIAFRTPLFVCLICAVG